MLKRKIINKLYAFVKRVIQEVVFPELNVLKKEMQENRKAFLSLYSYQQQKQTGNNRVIYTCLTGNYDILPMPLVIDESYDYVCFTDVPELLQLKFYGVWDIRPLVFSELDNTRNNRWHKLHPHNLFPEYSDSIYIDSNITFKTSKIYEIFREPSKKLIIPKHNYRDCIYEEFDAVVLAKKETEENCNKVREVLKQNNFPEHYGLNENNLIYRKHNDPKIIEIMEQWWSFVKDFSKRDQLSLAYILFKHGIKPSEIEIENLREQKNDFEVYLHRF